MHPPATMRGRVKTQTTKSVSQRTVQKGDKSRGRTGGASLGSPALQSTHTCETCELACSCSSVTPIPTCPILTRHAVHALSTPWAWGGVSTGPPHTASPADVCCHHSGAEAHRMRPCVAVADPGLTNSLSIDPQRSCAAPSLFKAFQTLLP